MTPGPFVVTCRVLALLLLLVLVNAPALPVPDVTDSNVFCASLLWRGSEFLNGSHRSRRSKHSSGCKLPSPAWNTLHTRRPVAAAISATCSNTSGNLVRGITPSCTM